jgi:hypothetical protein
MYKEQADLLKKDNAKLKNEASKFKAHLAER